MKIADLLNDLIDLLVVKEPCPRSDNSSSESAKADKWTDLWHERTQILYDASIARRYHHKRQSFFQMLEDVTQVSAILGGVVVAGVTLSGKSPLLGGFISFVSALAFVLKYSDKRQLHKELAVEALKIMQEIKSCENKNLNEGVMKKWEKMYFDMSFKEPPTLRNLAQQCEWEQCMEDGNNGYIEPVPLHKRLIMHFW